MNEQITTAAELDALPVGWAGIGVDGNIWQRVDARVEWQSLTGGGYTYASDFIRECAPLATLHRPDQPQRVQPSRAEAKAEAWDEGYYAGVSDYRLGKWYPTNTGAEAWPDRKKLTPNPHRLAPQHETDRIEREARP